MKAKEATVDFPRQANKLTPLGTASERARLSVKDRQGPPASINNAILPFISYLQAPRQISNLHKNNLSLLQSLDFSVLF